MCAYLIQRNFAILRDPSCTDVNWPCSSQLWPWQLHSFYIYKTFGMGSGGGEVEGKIYQVFVADVLASVVLDSHYLSQIIALENLSSV